MSLANPYQLCTQEQLEQGLFQTISEFWQAYAQESYFVNDDGKKIHYVSLIPQGADQAIVISPGRLEAYIKYQEMAYDLTHQGYAVFIIDHRGQGFSQRNLNNPHKGDIVSYDDFVNDFALWMDTVITPKGFKQLFAMGHSMGCVILTLYQQANPQRFEAMALASPMFGIKLFPLPLWFAFLLSQSLSALCHRAKIDPIFTPGTGNYKETPFAENKLTHSAKRYHLYQQFYERFPQVQLGGPTVRWLHQSFMASKKATKAAKDITIPIFIVQAGSDQIVTASQQNEFYQGLSVNKRLKVLKGAYHELYQESDIYRIPTITAALEFFSEVTKTA